MDLPDHPQATIVTDGPIVEVIGEMSIIPEGIMAMAKWVEKYRPHCLPAGGFKSPGDLVPHDGTEAGRHITENEFLVELAGRKCYDSFAEAGAKRTNGEYIKSMWVGRIPHRSTGYHAKMSYFFAHISRRVSHELIRNYVGSDRDEEGSPSQESTRFTHHPGVYIAHPNDLDDHFRLSRFKELAQRNYQDYCEGVVRKSEQFKLKNGAEPKGLDRKRIYESSAGDLLMSCGTSFIWTTNPMALTKFFHERDDEAADMEMARFARAVKQVSIARWPNLFPDFAPTR